MNSKTILIIGGLGAVGFLVYQKFFSSQAVNSNLVSQYADPTNRTQPAQKYPVQSPSQPRVDNQSEPWAAQLRNFLSNPSSNISQIKSFAGDLAAVGSITDSISGIWNDLDIGNWFGSSGDDFVPDAFDETDFTMDDFMMDSFDDFDFDW